MSDRTAKKDDRGSRFTVHDLHVYDDGDALAWLRERESTFFRSGGFNPSEAIMLLGVEALDSGVQEVSLGRRGGWWLLWSERDWLQGADAKRVFRDIVHNAHGGPNNLRFEVLLTAFADNVITMSHGNVDVVKGSLDHKLEAALKSLGQAGRVVAFKS